MVKQQRGRTTGPPLNPGKKDKVAIGRVGWCGKAVRRLIGNGVLSRTWFVYLACVFGLE
jgi:hypothetical protein